MKKMMKKTLGITALVLLVFAGWQFILARNAGGGWKVVDAGY